MNGSCGATLYLLPDLVHRHFFLGDDAAVDQKFSDRRIRLTIAGDIVEAQQFAVIELHPG